MPCNLSKQNNLIKAQLKDVEDITTLLIFKGNGKMHDLVIAYLEQAKGERE